MEQLSPQTTTIVLVISALMGIVATRYRPTWIVLRHLATLTHELGHALVGLFVGAQLKSIKLNRDSSGVTTTAHSLYSNGFSTVMTLLGGYPAPFFFGMGAIAAVLAGYQQIGWWVLAGLGVLLFLFVRNFFGLLVSACFLVICAPFTFWFGNEWYSAPVLVFVGTVIVAGGINGLMDLTKLTASKDDEGADSLRLREVTHISRRFWVAFFWVWSISLATAILVVPLTLLK